MALVAPFNLCTATGAGATLAKTLWPGTYTVTLPSAGSVATLYNSTTPIGGVFKPNSATQSALIDFACVGAADATVTLEIGGLAANGAIPEVIAQVTLKTITTSGTVANVNPFTGTAVAATTFRMVDLISISGRSNVSQLLTWVGGTEDNQPSTLVLDTRQFSWYYLTITSLGGLTSVTPVLTPISGPSPAPVVVSGSSSGGGGVVPALPSIPVANSQAVAVTTSGASYVAGDVVGGIISLTTVNLASGRRVSLKSLQVNDKGGVAPALHLYFFKATPSGGTYTDNAQLVWGSGDSANKVGQFNVATADYLTDISQSSANYSGLTMDLPVSATTLFVLIVSQGSYTITNGNLTLDLEFNQE